MNISASALDLIVSFGKTNGCQFIRIKDYTNQVGEVQDVTINIGTSYETAKEKDIETLKALDLSKFKVDNELTLAIFEQAKSELIAAAIAPNKAMSEGQKDAYTHLVKGVKVHNETNQLYIFGSKLKDTKVVKVEGDYKPDTRKPLTKAKDLIRATLKAPKYRQYIIGSLGAVTMKGDTIELS